MSRGSGTQLEIRLDKNGQRRGGKRPGAGRPKRGARASERHETRPKISAYEPVHVVMRVEPSVRSLRTHAAFLAIKEASFTAFAHDERAVQKPDASTLTTRLDRAFHIVHLSIQRTHIHLIVEASDRKALWRGIQAFGISAARHINAASGRSGRVFPDRYFARVLKTPAQVRNTLAYVLNNWKHHGESSAALRRDWPVDPYSTASLFDGWKELEGRRLDPPSGYDGPLVWWPKTWLLAEGWRSRGLISMDFIPGGEE